MDFNQRHRRPAEDTSPSAVYRQNQHGRQQDTDIHRQIQTRDEEILQLSQTTNHLRQRLDQTVETVQQQARRPPVPQRAEPSGMVPLRIREGSRSRSPHRPVRERSPQNYPQPPGYARDHISSLQNDNASLLRRLNLILQELERVTQEKNDLLHQVDTSSKEIDEMHRIINGEDNTDKVNRYMQDDLGAERINNSEVRDKIKNSERIAGGLVQELRKLQEESEMRSEENSVEDQELRRILQRVKDTENDHYFTVEKLAQVDNSIQELRNEEVLDQRQIQELQRTLGVLIGDRNELLQKLEHLTIRYDETVREITADRKTIVHHNERQSKLVTAKLLFTLLEKAQKSRIRKATDEMKAYCHFDQKCHKKLVAFASTGQRQCQKLMKLALMKWAQRALEPMKLMAQSNEFAENTANSQLKAKMFHQWLELYQQRVKTYESKNEAVKMVWNFRRRDLKVEKARYFTIWRDHNRLFTERKRMLMKVIWRKYFNKLNHAFNNWVGHSYYINSQIRLRMLASEYAIKNYETSIFYGMKVFTVESKRKKFSRQLKAFKAWKDYINKKRFFYQSNIATMQLIKQNEGCVLKTCFDAFRKHKETQKYQKTHFELTEVELPLKEQLGQEIDERVTTANFKAKQRACEAVKSMMAKQIISYFKQWKEETDRHRITLQTKVKQRIIKVYLDQLRTTFNLWKVQGNSKVSKMQLTIIQENQEHALQLTNVILEEKRELNEQKEIKDCSKKKNTTKVLMRMQRRQLEQSMARWRDHMADERRKEGGAYRIIKRLKMRLYRKAFDLYKEGVALKRKEALCISRCRMLLNTTDERVLFDCFQGIKLFVANFRKAKEYWRRLDTRLNISRKRQGFKKWHKWNQRSIEKSLKTNEAIVNEKIIELNKSIGKLSTDETKQRTEIDSQNKRMTKQAQRIISNAFARYYYVGLTRGFEKWKEYAQFETHKIQLFKRMAARLKNNQMYFVKSTFKNWILATKVAETKSHLRLEELKVADQEFQLDVQTKTYEEEKSNYDKHIQEGKAEGDKQSRRYQMQVQNIMKQMDNNHFMSRQKYIFQQWALFVRRQKHFVKSTINVINKSLWQEGFKALCEHSRSQAFQTKKEKHLEQFRRKFWKRTCGSAFSKWRETGYKTVLSTVHALDQEQVQVTEDYAEMKQSFKNANADKSGKTLKRQNLRNLWVGWCTVKNLMKFHRIKDDTCRENLGLIAAKKLLIRWKSRSDATKIARNNVLRMKNQLRLMKLKQYFNGFKNSRDIHFNLLNRLNNLSRVMDHQCTQSAFQAIGSFARSKAFSHLRRKEQAARDLLSHLDLLMKRELQKTLTHLKVIPMIAHRDGLKKFQVVCRNLTAQQRRCFDLWKTAAQQRTLKKEMNEEGPVRDEIWELEKTQRNLKAFMQQEGYSKDDVQLLQAHGNEQYRNLLTKVKARMDHYNEEKYPLPKFFDRWKKYIQMKRLMRYYLNFCANRSEYLKSDLASAFTQWKKQGEKQQKEYSAISRDKLEKRVIKNCENIEGLADNIGDKENYLSHLDIQREELMENFIKGQKLALSLWINNKRRIAQQAFSLWVSECRSQRRHEADFGMKENISQIQDMKDRVQELENENLLIGDENEDLNTLSAEGYEMSQKAKRIQYQVENLSVDLADKSSTIMKLLEDNEILKAQLLKVHGDSNDIMRSMKKGGYSPSAKKAVY